jgi:hypothetical protein
MLEERLSENEKIAKNSQLAGLEDSEGSTRIMWSGRIPQII